MDDMVERIAHQICLECFPGAAPWELQSKDSVTRRTCLRAARESIALLRHPITEKMRKACLRQISHGHSPDQIIWATLGAALGERTE